MLEMLRIKLLRALLGPAFAWKWRGKRAQNLATREVKIPVQGGEIRARVYTPQGSGPFPLMLYIHGGGWVGFNIDTHDPLCRDLCVASAHVVVSVDYRLAPEHPFPIPANDCVAALAWLRAQAAALNGDIDRLVIAGDSAGGNLAAVLAIHARENFPGLVKGQVLIYPVTDDRHADWPSYTTYGKPPYELTTVGMKWLWDLYLRNSPLLKNGDARHDLLTPLHVKNLSGLPPAFVVLAQCDVLHDEGLAYAQRLAKEGNDVRHKVYPAQQHGFVGTSPGVAHTEAVNDIAAWLKAKGL